MKNSDLYLTRWALARYKGGIRLHLRGLISISTVRYLRMRVIKAYREEVYNDTIAIH